MTDQESWRAALREINEELKYHCVESDNMTELAVMLDALAAAIGRVFLDGNLIPSDLEDVLMQTRKHTNTPLIDTILLSAVRSITEESSKANYWAEADGMASDVRDKLSSELANITRTVDQMLREVAT